MIEELPKHKDFRNLLPGEVETYNRQSISAMNTAEILKRQIKDAYEREAHEFSLNTKNVRFFWIINI